MSYVYIAAIAVISGLVATLIAQCCRPQGKRALDLDADMKTLQYYYYNRDKEKRRAENEGDLLKRKQQRLG